MMRGLLFALLLLAIAGAAGVAAEARDGACSAAAAGPCPSYDRDGDGVRNEPPYPEGTQPDNCPDHKNAGQEDTDADGPGDACDPDDDGDQVEDGQDNCRLIANPDQADDDGNGYGNPCPPADSDGDGVTDDRDNCVRRPNPDQADSEPSQPDGYGDVCDADDDDDGVADYMDNCPFVDNPEQTDDDGDTRGRACDPDEIAPPADPATGPGDGGSNGTAGPDGPSAVASETDRTAPVVTVAAPRTWTAADLRGRAPVSVRCSEACGLSARLTLRGKQLASGTGILGAGGRTYVFFTARRGTVARVTRLRTRAPAVLTVRAVDEAGNRRTVMRRVWLRR